MLLCFVFATRAAPLPVMCCSLNRKYPCRGSENAMPGTLHSTCRARGGVKLIPHGPPPSGPTNPESPSGRKQDLKQVRLRHIRNSIFQLAATGAESEGRGTTKAAMSVPWFAITLAFDASAACPYKTRTVPQLKIPQARWRSFGKAELQSVFQKQFIKAQSALFTQDGTHPASQDPDVPCVR